MPQEERTSFGVYKPVGHIVISLPTSGQADDAVQAIGALGVPAEDVQRFTDQQMLRQIGIDLARASPIAGVGQELNLVKAHRELAARGYHWLVVRAGGDERVALIADAARRCGAERAQSYGIFIIEELIERPGGLPQQVGESPDRGLDAQTPSGNEGGSAAVPPVAPPSHG